jgi:hypothetical protein
VAVVWVFTEYAKAVAGLCPLYDEGSARGTPDRTLFPPGIACTYSVDGGVVVRIPPGYGLLVGGLFVVALPLYVWASNRLTSRDEPTQSRT